MIKARIQSLYHSVERSALAKRLVSGTIYLTAGAVLARLLALVGTLFVVRFLGRETYGLFAIIQSSIVMAGVFAGMGLGATAIKHIAQLKDRDKKHLGRLLSLIGRIAVIGSLSIAVFFSVGSGFIAVKLLNAPEISSLLALAALSVPFNVLFGYFNSSLLGFEAVRQSAASQVIAIGLSTPLLLGLTYQYGLTGSVWGFIIQSVLLFATSWHYYHKQCISWHISSDHNYGPMEWAVIRNFTFPAFLTAIIVMPVHWINYATLMNTSNGSAEMATIGIAMQWFYALMFLPALAGRIILSVLSDMLAGDQKEKTGKVLKFSLLANAITIVPIAILIVAASPWIMAAYGKEYIADWPVLAVIVVASALSALVSPAGQLIVASGRMWLTSVMNTVWAAVYIFLSWLWIDKGALGIAMAMLVAYGVLSSWTTLFAFQYQSRNRI